MAIAHPPDWSPVGSRTFLHPNGVTALDVARYQAKEDTSSPEELRASYLASATHGGAELRTLATSTATYDEILFAEVVAFCDYGDRRRHLYLAVGLQEATAWQGPMHWLLRATDAPENFAASCETFFKPMLRTLQIGAASAWSGPHPGAIRAANAAQRALGTLRDEVAPLVHLRPDASKVLLALSAQQAMKGSKERDDAA